MVILDYSNKGGAGKTTSAISIAGILADSHKKRVLYIDSDTQMNSTDVLFKNDEAYQTHLRENNVKTLKTAFENNSLEDCIYHVFFPKRSPITGRVVGEYCIDIIPGDNFLDSLDLAVTALRELLFPIINNYDYIIVDMHPSKAGITLTAFDAADYIFIPTAPNEFHIKGIKSAAELLEGLQLSGYALDTTIIGSFFTMYRKNVALQNALQNSYANYEKLFFKNTTRDASILAESLAYGLPINSYKPTHIVTKEYKAIVNELLKRINEDQKGGK